MGTRKADFAGSWYPGNASECEKEIKGFLKESSKQDSLNKDFVGGIVPHAGWYFSGNIACNVISCIKDDNPLDTMLVFGMHLHAGSPCYIMTKGAWETPFGDIQIEEKLAKELTKQFDFSVETYSNYTHDNTIELQLPFIKYFFKDIKIVPMGVPPIETSLEIGRAAVEIAEKLGLKIKVLGSTDLTHYGSNYGFSPKGSGKNAHQWVRDENDRKVIDAMLDMNPEAVLREALANQNACCAGAAATAIAASKKLGASSAQSIAYATSYEKSPGDSFVGYTGIVF